MEAENAEKPAPKKRGRPPGRRNRPVLDRGILTPPSSKVKGDYAHADIDTLVARQLSMLDWAQQATRNEMMRAYQAKGVSIQAGDIDKLTALATSLLRTVDALKKTSDLADELASRLTPEQLMEAALKKIEGQDRATLRYAIKRLRAYLEKLGPVNNSDQLAMGEMTATGAIRLLEEAE